MTVRDTYRTSGAATGMSRAPLSGEYAAREMPRAGTRWLGAAGDWALACATSLLIAAHRWWQMGAHPPGIDQGHWLAFGHAYWSHANSSLTDLFPPTVMPPLVPTLMAVVTQFGGPEVASRLLATASIVSIMLASFAVLRRATPAPIATLISLFIGISATVIEPAAWGGYPQNFAVAGMVIATYSASLYMTSKSRKALILFASSTLLVSLSHHAYFGVLIVSLAGVLVIWMTSRPGWVATCVVMGKVCLAAIPSFAVFGIVVVSLLKAQYDPAVDASGSSLGTALQYDFPTAQWLWITLGVLGLYGLVVGGITRRHPDAWRAALAMALVATVAFGLTGEARFIPPLVIGLALGVGLAVDGLSNDGTDRAATAIAVASLLAMLALAWPSTDRKAQIAFEYYSVLDPSMVHVAEFLDSAPGSGKVAVRTDARGWPVGWWLRGLTGRSVLVGSDPRWLGFPGERSQAAQVERLFDEAASADAVRRLALQDGVDLLVYRPQDWGGWRDWPADPDAPLTEVYNDGEYVILAVRGAP